MDTIINFNDNYRIPLECFVIEFHSNYLIQNENKKRIIILKYF